jgi:hypothetical protein
MSRRIEIHQAPWGMVRLEIWVNGHRASISEAIPRSAAQMRIETMSGTSVEVIDHTRQKDIHER